MIEVNKDFFENWSDNMAYILGYWYADGCIWKEKSSYRWNITSNDLDHLKKIRSIMDSKNKIYDRKDDNSHDFRISRKKIYCDIIRLGGTERKSLTTKFPSIPKEYTNHFIRGYFDGDGCIYLRRGNPHITLVGTKDFLKKLMSNLPYIGRFNKYSQYTFGLFYSGEYAQSVLKFMYNDVDLYLDRKYKLYKDSMKWQRKCKIHENSMLLKLNGKPGTINE